MQFDRKMQEQQGQGLGLTIAKRLTELHGGTLMIRSTKGVGTTVTVSFPRKRSQQMPEPLIGTIRAVGRS